MKFLLDQDVYATTVRFLSNSGYDIVLVAQIRLARADDEVLLRVAHEQGRILITRDQRFRQPRVRERARCRSPLSTYITFDTKCRPPPIRKGVNHLFLRRIGEGIYRHRAGRPPNQKTSSNMNWHPANAVLSKSLHLSTTFVEALMQFARITHDPAVMGGKPCIRGFRVIVDMILGLLAAGQTREWILQAYPYLELEDIDATLAR